MNKNQEKLLSELATSDETKQESFIEPIKDIVADYEMINQFFSSKNKDIIQGYKKVFKKFKENKNIQFAFVFIESMDNSVSQKIKAKLLEIINHKCNTVWNIRMNNKLKRSKVGAFISY